ncbi:hypothetical protein HVY60_08890 [Citrobacter freundii]|uniref:hypothetical protein n=1 Tax=Citrobacter freundii TaxID=546 RepID=UPI0015EEF0C7|nr:hypothetical protein [Citrobacter freundii]QMG39041.1 hypothetical protein HVY60_08890 [Citrobacter freundii]
MTNNHPAHGPVSLDRLHQIREILSKAAAQSDGGNFGYAMADAVKVIDGAIAAFGAEPAGYADPQSLVNFKSMGGKNAACTKEWMWRDPYNGLIPLYTAPPAPVVPPERQSLNNGIVGFDEGWNACRAAMLRAEPRNGQQNIPEIIPGGLVEAVNNLLNNDGSRGCYSAMECSAARDKIELWLTQRQRWEGQRNDNLSTGNSPVTPDDWQLVPKEPTEAMNKAGWAAINEHDAINPTYRAMLAAAPQQDVK